MRSLIQTQYNWSVYVFWDINFFKCQELMVLAELNYCPPFSISLLLTLSLSLPLSNLFLPKPSPPLYFTLYFLPSLFFGCPLFVYPTLAVFLQQVLQLTKPLLLSDKACNVLLCVMLVSLSPWQGHCRARLQSTA